MTTTPAMPELPETDYYLGFFNEGGAQLTGLRGYTADQMDARYLRGYNDALATLQAQPAEVSDEEIERIAIESDLVFRSGGKLLTQFLEHIDLTRNVHAFARAILALRPQAVPMTDEQAALEEEEFFLLSQTQVAALLWVLWCHQGASSPVGQPIRFALGMDKRQEMSDEQVSAAQRFRIDWHQWSGITAPAGGEG